MFDFTQLEITYCSFAIFMMRTVVIFWLACLHLVLFRGMLSFRMLFRFYLSRCVLSPCALLHCVFLVLDLSFCSIFCIVRVRSAVFQLYVCFIALYLLQFCRKLIFAMLPVSCMYFGIASVNIP